MNKNNKVILTYIEGEVHPIIIILNERLAQECADLTYDEIARQALTFVDSYFPRIEDDQTACYYVEMLSNGDIRSHKYAAETACID